MHNFFIDKLGETGEEVLLPSSESKHLFKTLRASKGDVIGLLDGKGGFAEAEIIDNKRIMTKTISRQAEPVIKVNLFVATPKRAKMDQLLRQCTEAGVWAIYPIITEYSVAVPDKISDRWITLLQESCKQSGNLFLPEIHNPCSLEDSFAIIKEKNMTAFYGAVSSDLHDFPSTSTPDIAWFVGPEGGFSPEEIEIISSFGVRTLNLGRCIMRVETAAVCGISVLNFYNKEKCFE